MNNDQTNHLPHRSTPLNMIPIEDYNKVVKELETAYQECFVRLVDTTKPPVIVYCDDDYPNSNDGCQSSR